MASLTLNDFTLGDEELEEAIRKCAKATKGKNIKPVFQKMDNNGDGVLGAKEFTKLLHKFGVKLGKGPYDKLMKALDKDGDDVVSYKEFQAMIRTVQNIEDAERHEEREAAKAQRKQMKEMAKEQARILEEGRGRRKDKGGAAEKTAGKSSTKKKSSASEDHEGLAKLWKKIKKYIVADGDEEVDGVALFKKMFEQYDTNGDGELTLEELAEGLGNAGVKTTKKNFKALLAALDKGGDGKVSLKEFVKGTSKALK